MLGVRQVTTKKGTTVTNRYQKNTPKTSAGPGLAVPDDVTVAMSEIADDMREGLLALAVGAGLLVMSSLMEADVAAACGPRGKHDPQRTAVRHGRERGSVTLGGRRVGVERPRMRATGGGEVPVPAYERNGGMTAFVCSGDARERKDEQPQVCTRRCFLPTSP